MKIIYSVLLAFILPISLFCQEFKPVKSNFQASGIADWNNNQTVLFGNGLLFLNQDGSIDDKIRILPGIPDSEFKDAALDSKGNLWLAGQDHISKLYSDKTVELVIDPETYDFGRIVEIHLNSKNEIFILGRKLIVKIDASGNHKVLFNQPEPNLSFQHMALTSDDKYYVLSHQQILLVNSNGSFESTPYSQRLNTQALVYTPDNKLLIVDYHNIFELKDGKIDYFLKGSQLLRGLRLYDALFTSSTDFWLYANEGNMFHNNNGQWINYTPPAGLKTGNYGEALHLSKNGDLWLSLRRQALLKFDGASWQRIETSEKKSVPNIGMAKLIGGNQLVVRRYDPDFYSYFSQDNLLKLGDIPSKDVVDIKKYDDDIYYATKSAIFKVENGVSKKITDAQNIKHFGVTSKNIIYCGENHLYEFENGVHTKLTDNIHHMGWDDDVYAKIRQLSNGQIALFSNKRLGLLSLYNGKTWTKVIEVEGKRINKILDIVLAGDQVYILNDQGSLISYKDGQFKFLHEEPYQKKSLNLYTFPCPDQSIWIRSSSNDLSVWKDGEYQNLEYPLKQSGKVLRAIVPQQEKGKYYFYAGDELFECTLNK